MTNILINENTFDAPWCFNQFKTHIKETHKVAVIPFTFRDEKVYSTETWEYYYNKENGGYCVVIESAFQSYGILSENIEWVNYFIDSPQSAADKINGADVIYLCGGLPDKCMERLIEFKLTGVIQNYSGVMLGVSAGAMVQLNRFHITPDKDYAEFVYNSGLGLINGFDIEVHFDNSEVQRKSIQRIINETGTNVYAIGEEGAVMVQDGVITTLGDVTLYNGE